MILTRKEAHAVCQAITALNSLDAMAIETTFYPGGDRSCMARNSIKVNKAGVIVVNSADRVEMHDSLDDFMVAYRLSVLEKDPDEKRGALAAIADALRGR